MTLAISTFRKIIILVLFIALFWVAGLAIFQRTLIYASIGTDQFEEANWQAIKGIDRELLGMPDGVHLSTWYLSPKDNQPVFFFLHGNGGYVANKWRWNRLREQGYGIFVFSQRGYAGSEGSPTEELIYEDTKVAYDWLSRRHLESDIIIHGFSLGSAIAAELARHVNAKAVILEAPFTRLGDVIRDRYWGLPLDLLLLDKFETEKHIHNINMPILIAHGTKDTIVPFELGERLFKRASTRQSGKIDFLVFEGSDHNTLVRDGLYPKVWEWIDDLPAKPIRSSLIH